MNMIIVDESEHIQERQVRPSHGNNKFTAQVWEINLVCIKSPYLVHHLLQGKGEAIPPSAENVPEKAARRESLNVKGQLSLNVNSNTNANLNIKDKEPSAGRYDNPSFKYTGFLYNQRQQLD